MLIIPKYDNMNHDQTIIQNPYLNVILGFTSLFFTSLDYTQIENQIEYILKIAVLALTLFTLLRNVITKPNNKQNENEINVDID